jgi:hypothetical protein
LPAGNRSAGKLAALHKAQAMPARKVWRVITAGASFEYSGELGELAASFAAELWRAGIAAALVFQDSK